MKFSATKLGDMLTTEAREGRASRIAQYAARGEAFRAVVHVEADDGSWCELDAEDKAHAIRLADHWVTVGNARGASCRELRGTSGAVKLASFYTKFADIGGDWD